MKNIFTVLLLAALCGCAKSQDAVVLIRSIDQKLQSGQMTVTQALTDTALMSLHPQTEFREVIKRNAKAGPLRMVADSEPGRRITVRGQVIGSDGQPLGDALVYVYQTSDKGWYSDTAAHILANEGDMRHARLFAYLKTDAEGRFEYETVMPKGYPRSDFPAHIHIGVWKDGALVHGLPGELQFDDDPRQTPERKKRSLEDGNLIEKNSGTPEKPVYVYRLQAKR